MDIHKVDSTELNIETNHSSSWDSTNRLGLRPRKIASPVSFKKIGGVRSWELQTAVGCMDTVYLISVVALVVIGTVMFGNYNNIREEVPNDEDPENLLTQLLGLLSQGDPILHLNPVVSQLLRTIAVLCGLFGVVTSNEMWILSAAGSFLLDLIRAGLNLDLVGTVVATVFFYPHLALIYTILKENTEESEIEQDGWLRI